MKNITAILVGLIVGAFVISFIQWMGIVLFPSDLPLSENRSERMEYMLHLPFMAKLFMIISYGLAGFVAGTVATFIQGRTDFKPTLIITGVLQLLIWMSMTSMPHPFWMWVGGTITIIPCGYWAFWKFKREKIN